MAKRLHYFLLVDDVKYTKVVNEKERLVTEPFMSAVMTDQKTLSQEAASFYFRKLLPVEIQGCEVVGNLRIMKQKKTWFDTYTGRRFDAVEGVDVDYRQ